MFEIPFGANIPDEAISKYYSAKAAPSSEVKIVFISTNWEGKNGDKAIEICRSLINAGVTVRLITIGKIPAHIGQIDFVDNRGILDKSIPKQLAEFCTVLREAHFLLLPTKFDAFGIVFSEAQAFGVPPVSNDVGGVGSAITNRETGLLLPIGASPERFGQEMLVYIRDAKLYSELSQRCRRRYLEHANWSNWSDAILKLAENSKPA